MRVRTIDFDGEEDPTEVTVTMTVAEAIFVAKLVGTMVDSDAANVAPHGVDSLHSIFSCLTGAFFNRFWDDGVDEAMRS